MPDVMVEFSGLRTVVEGEVSDQSDAESRALQSAGRRVEQGIAQIGIAVVYPETLRHAQFTRLKNQLAACTLKFAVVTEAGATGFAEGDVNGLCDVLRRAYDQLVQENVVSEAVAALEAGIEKFASTVTRRRGLAARLAETLGIRELPDPTDASDPQASEDTE